MTEYEMWQLVADYMGEANGVLMFLWQIIFAYLGMAYFMGLKLSKLQVSIVNTLLCIVFFFTFFFRNQIEARRLTFLDRITDVNPEIVIIPGLPYATDFMGVVILLACYKFMWDVRHSKMPQSVEGQVAMTAADATTAEPVDIVSDDD
jgi:hypothetical protein